MELHDFRTSPPRRKARSWVSLRTTAYTRRMRSVADDLRRAGRASFERLTVSERVELVFRLGDDDSAMLAAAAGISPEAARRRLAAQRARGRQRSVANAARP